MIWKEVQLEDVCEVGRGSSPRPINNKAYFEGGNIPWIKIADATASGKFIYRTKEKVNVYGASFSRCLPKGALILATSGVSLGQVKFLGVEGCIHDGWLYLKNYKGIDKEFLYYKLIGLQSYFHGNSYGAAIQNINTDILRRTKVIIPPLPTQKKISSILSAYDDSIENNLKRIQLLEEAAQRIYKEWFVDFKFPNHENTTINPETGLPEGWKIEKAESIFNINIGKTPPRKESEWFSYNEGVKWASISDMNKSSTYIFNTKEKITFEGVKRFNVKVIPENTVILSFKLTVGAVAITTEDMVTNEAIAHFNTNENTPSTEFTYLHLKSFNYNTLGNTSSIGVAINSKIVKSMPFLKTPKKVEDKFTGISKPIFQQINILLRQNQNLKEARDLLLPRLMNRTIEV